MLGTTSIAEDDAGNKYFLASPNCAPAAVHPNKVLHSLCFEKRPAAKNSVCPIPFHLVSLKLSSLQLTPHICRLEYLKRRVTNRISMQPPNQFVESICTVERAGDMPLRSHPVEASLVQIFLAPLPNKGRAVLTRA
jgi:hypothetical protein